MENHINLSNNSKTNIYPLFLKTEKIPSEKDMLIVNFVANGEELPTIFPGTLTIGGWGVAHSDIIEVLEERPAKGEHQIENPIFYSVKCKAVPRPTLPPKA